MQWAEVGGNNTADPSTGLGAVSYIYHISKSEVTNAQYTEFLNAVAAADPNGLYDTSMGSGFGGITRGGTYPSYEYSVIAGRGDMPVNFVSFYDAMRYTNWLHNGQPTGAQGPTTTECGAYELACGSPDVSPVHNSTALYWLPTENEWYKAAYYDAAANVYFPYPPAGSSGTTACVAPPGGANSANCTGAVGNLSNVGSYPGSASASGTFDQGGNVHEWNEWIGPFPSFARGLRGGGFADGPSYLAAVTPHSASPTSAYFDVGFRVASFKVVTNLSSGKTVPVLSPIGMSILWSLLGLAGSRSLRTRRSVL